MITAIIKGDKMSDKKIISITKSLDPTQKRAPWRIAYEKNGKEYARYETSLKRALEYASGDNPVIATNLSRYIAKQGG